MKRLRSMLTYANVIATVALFLALGGGAVWAANNLAKNSVKSQDIAANAVKSRNLAANAVKSRNLAAKAVKGKHLAANSVSGVKVKKEALTRSKLKAGTLAGLQVAEATAANVPGLTTPSTTPDGTPITLAGTTSFVPNTGKSYLLLAELRGNPSDADGVNSSSYGGPSCYAWVRISVNGEPTAWVEISANANQQPPNDVNPVGTSSTAVALQQAGVTQTISANAFGNSGCGAGTTGNLRIVVVELG
jgi:hypothetical protein